MLETGFKEESLYLSNKEVKSLSKEQSMKHTFSRGVQIDVINLSYKLKSNSQSSKYLLNNINMKVDAGDLVAIMGPSGKNI